MLRMHPSSLVSGNDGHSHRQARVQAGWLVRRGAFAEVEDVEVKSARVTSGNKIIVGDEDEWTSLNYLHMPAFYACIGELNAVSAAPAGENRWIWAKMLYNCSRARSSAWRVSHRGSMSV